MARWLMTDEEFVERLRRWERWRRPLAIVFLLLGLATVAATLYAVNQIQAEAIAGFSEVHRMLNPTTQQAQAVWTAVEFNVGMRLGFSLATILAAGLSLLTASFALFVKSRKDRLLLRLWDEQSGPKG